MSETTGTVNSSQAISDIQSTVKVFVVDIPFALICFTIFTIYASLWDRQRVHGWIVMATAATFCIRSSTIVVRDVAIHVAAWNVVEEAPIFCVSLGLLHHWAYLSSLCWTVVLGLDLWNGMRRMTKRHNKTVRVKRLVLYATFCFGLPIINVGLASILEWKTGIIPPQWKLKRPLYGWTCKVHSSVAFWYLGIPTLILMAPNLILLGRSWFYLWDTSKITREAVGLSEQQVNINFVRRSFRVFLIMGGLFVIDTVLYFSGFYKRDSYWRIPAETLCRVGIALACAWVFLCNDKVKGQLIHKYPKGIGRLLLRSK